MRRLGIRSTTIDDSTNNTHTQLKELIKGIEKGYFGAKKGSNRVDTGVAPFDLLDERNDEGIYVLAHGSKPKPSAGKPHGRAERWFAFVEHDADDNRVDMVDIDMQLSIVRGIMGADPYLHPDVKRRRTEGWRNWWLSQSGGGDVKRVDIPLIAKEYRDVFPFVIPDDINWSRDGILLRAIEDDLKSMIRTSGVMGTASNRDGEVSPVRRGAAAIHGSSHDGIVSGGSGASTTSVGSCRGSSGASLASVRSLSSLSSVTKPMPDAFLKDRLKCADDNGIINVGKVQELASLEAALIMLDSRKDGRTVREMLNADDIPVPMSISPEAIESMGDERRYAVRSVNEARRALIEDAFGGLFAPDDGMMLHEWMGEGR